MSEKAEFKSGLTARSIIIGVSLTVIIAALGTLSFLFGGPWHEFRGCLAEEVSAAAYADHMVAVPWITVAVVLGVLSRLLKLRMEEYVFLFAMIAPIPWLVGSYGVPVVLLWGSPALGAYIRGDPTWTVFKEYGPNFWGPKDPEILEQMLSGGYPVPWGAFAPSVSYFLLYWISFYFFSFFLASILRRAYVEVEELPFPVATMVDAAAKSLKKREMAKYLGIGTLISYVLYILVFTPEVFPDLGLPHYDFLMDIGISQQTVNPVLLSIDPFLIGFFFMLPPNVLLTAFLTRLLLDQIIPQVASAAGIIASSYGYEEIGLWKYWDLVGGNWIFEPFGPWNYVAFFMGVWAALGIYPLIINRRQIARSLKSVISPDKELDSKETVPYRWQWILLILFFILWVATWVIAAVPVTYSLLICGYFVIFLLGSIRLIAETGGNVGNTVTGVWMPGAERVTYEILSIQGGFSETARISFLTLASITLENENAWSVWNYSPLLPFTSSLALAFRSRSRSRDVLIAVIVSTVLSLIIGSIVGLWVFFTFGGKEVGPYDMSRRVGRILLDTARSIQTDYICGWWPLPDWTSLARAVFGFILVIAIVISKARFPSLFIEPSGIALAGFYPHNFLPILIALILKVMALKYFGVEKYSSKGIPLAVGLIAGTGLCYVTIKSVYGFQTLSYAMA